MKIPNPNFPDIFDYRDEANRRQFVKNYDEATPSWGLTYAERAERLARIVGGLTGVISLNPCDLGVDSALSRRDRSTPN